MVVAKYPSASWAAEAQFRAGWLEINRAHFREALPDLRQTLTRYPKSKFADDAAWYLALRTTCSAMRTRRSRPSRPTRGREA
jgi:TolA-binding protein